jgi:flagellar protein FliS
MHVKLAHGRFFHDYRKHSANSGSPLHLVVMMYDSAIRHMEAGRTAMQLNDLKSQNEHLQKAQKNVVDLISCLDLNDGGEIAKNLHSLYIYVLNELVEANVQNKLAPLDRSIIVFNDLRDSWAKFELAIKHARQADDERLAS